MDSDAFSIDREGGDDGDDIVDVVQQDNRSAISLRILFLYKNLFFNTSQ